MSQPLSCVTEFSYSYLRPIEFQPTHNLNFNIHRIYEGYIHVIKVKIMHIKVGTHTTSGGGGGVAVAATNELNKLEFKERENGREQTPKEVKKKQQQQQDTKSFS